MRSTVRMKRLARSRSFNRRTDLLDADATMADSYAGRPPLNPFNKENDTGVVAELKYRRAASQMERKEARDEG